MRSISLVSVSLFARGFLTGIGRQLARGCLSLATLFGRKAIARLILFKYEQVLEEEFKIEKKRQRATWVRLQCVRREKVQDCLFLQLATQFFVAMQVAKKGCYTQFHPQLVSERLSSALSSKLQEELPRVTGP